MQLQILLKPATRGVIVEKFHRREMLLSAIGAISTLPLLVISKGVRAANMACVEPASESLRDSLSYMDPGPDSAQRCGGCDFFDNSGTCGHCQIMSGPVSATGHCDSWAAKS